MTNWAVVAIPNENDPVWKYSSEKIPHMTLLFLGSPDSNVDTDRVTSFIQHATTTMLTRFGLEVDHRGTLGPEDADVLFFSQNHIKNLTDFRSALLKDSDIARMYLNADQYDQWTPHLTMGYPTTPAKPDNRDYPGFGWVDFEKIALWISDYSGPEFELPTYSGMDLAMSDTAIKEFIAHVSKTNSLTTVKRKALAEQGLAMPDGSCPIRTKADLIKAISTFGLTTKPKSDVKAWIIKRAKDLGATSSLPQNWGVVPQLAHSVITSGKDFISSSDILSKIL